MTPRDCWLKHRRLDEILSDATWLTGNRLRKEMAEIIVEIWQAVKQAANEEETCSQ